MSAHVLGDVVWTTIRCILRLDVASLREAPRWLATIPGGYSPLQDGRPWMNYAAVRYLRERLPPRPTVFEYGSGGSTVYWLQRGARVISVEHDEEWYHRVKDALKRRGITDCTCMLRKPRLLHAGATTTVRSALMPDKDLTSYVHAIDPYPDASFDLVLVDGRARVECLHRAIPKLRSGGYLVLDNSQRRRYEATVRELSRKYPVRHFVGIVPGRPRGFGTTTVWRIS